MAPRQPRGPSPAASRPSASSSRGRLGTSRCFNPSAETPISLDEAPRLRKWKTDVPQSKYLRDLAGPAGSGSAQEVSNDGKPLTLCAVDMGTNSFHMVIVKADAGGNVVVVEQMKEEVRILGGAGSFNVILEDKEAEAISVLKRIQNIAVSKACDAVRLVGTSAVREARNGNAFLRHVQEETGLQVEVISGQEEARLVYLGAMQAVPIRDKDVLVVDIGGGSTEILYGQRGKPAFAISLQLGHLRLFEQCIGPLAEDGHIPAERIQECRSTVQLVLNETGIKEDLEGLVGGRMSEHIDVAVGCSGTIERVGAMVSAMNAGREGGLLDVSAEAAGLAEPRSKVLYTVYDNLEEGKFTRQGLADLVGALSSCKTRKERSSLPGMNLKRVDLIVTGALILEGIMDYLQLDSMTVSPFALREGIIFDTLTKTIEGFEPTPCIRRDSVMHLATRFDTENRLRSAEHSARLAKQLLGSLRKGPKPPRALEILDERHEFLLEAAILLHSVGIFVNHAKHHKHAYYIIKNSDVLLGFTPMEVEILALLAIYHRKKYPSPKKTMMSGLPKEVQDRVMLMTAILRVCVALDRRNTAAAVESIQVLQDEEGETCVLVACPGVDCDGAINDISFELWAVRQELPFLKKILKRAFSVVEGDVHPGEAKDSYVSS